MPNNNALSRVLTILIVGKGKNIYYILETLYNLLGGSYFQTYHRRESQGAPNEGDDKLVDVEKYDDLAIALVTSDDYIEKASWKLELLPAGIGHEEIDAWLQEWKKLIIAKGGAEDREGEKAWQEIVASQRLRLWRVTVKQVLNPFELWIPTILRPELDFRLIENALDIAKPDVVVITSDTSYYNIRLLTQVRWAIKQRLSALRGSFSPETVPIVISNIAGPEYETVKNLMALQRAMPYSEKAVSKDPLQEPDWGDTWRLWEQDYPMAFPDAVTYSYLSASEKTLGVLEAVRVWEDAKRSDEIPLGLNVCLHDVPGATCRLALGLAGLKPDFDLSKNYPFLSIQHTLVKSVSDERFNGSFLARLIGDCRDRKRFIEYFEKPVIAAIYNFLEPLKDINDRFKKNKALKKKIPHPQEMSLIDEKVKGSRALYLLRDVRKRFITLNEDRELAENPPLCYDKPKEGLWENFSRIVRRGNTDCCPGRLECPIYSYMATLEVDSYYGKTRAETGTAGRNVRKDGPELKDRYIEHTYFASALECSDNCRSKITTEQLRRINDYALIHFCGRESRKLGIFGKLLAHLLFANTGLVNKNPNSSGVNRTEGILGVPAQTVVDMSYIRDYQCLNKTCSFTEVFGRLIFAEPKELTINPVDAVLIVIINERKLLVRRLRPSYTSSPFYQYLKKLSSYLLGLYGKKDESGYHLYYGSLGPGLNDSDWDHRHLLLLRGDAESETGENCRNRFIVQCKNCGASPVNCYIKRRLVEGPRGEAKGETRRSLEFLPI